MSWITRPETSADAAAIRAITVAAFDTSDEALMAMTLDESRPLPGGLVRYAAPFGI